MISLLFCFFSRKYQIEFFLICALSLSSTQGKVSFSNMSAFASLNAGRRLNLRVECTPKSTKRESINAVPHSFIQNKEKKNNSEGTCNNCT